MTTPIWLALGVAAAVVLVLLITALAGRFTLSVAAPAGGEARTPQLVPERPSAEDLALVRFSSDVPGYAPGQVDAVLARVGAELARQRERIAELEAEQSDSTRALSANPG
ncbi:MAG: DivIVA domain-containing protein [Micrococcus sp.]|nr:DivIVA domain-containing protein [Micrococcus sp.]